VNIKQETLISKDSIIDSPFFKTLAKIYLEYLGNSNPTSKQLTEMQVLLPNTCIKLPIRCDLRLTEQEKECLYLSAQRKRIKEIALFMKVSTRRVTQYRQSIFEKLNCKNITSAIIVGIRYGEINIKDLTEK
jgi:DNA-binding CsgD family transcriptional regulator